LIRSNLVADIDGRRVRDEHAFMQQFLYFLFGSRFERHLVFPGNESEMQKNGWYLTAIGLPVNRIFQNRRSSCKDREKGI
jgi:hypothetical protein